ncbi:MAG: TonB-dependent receptor, partial [Cyclobacteriaceae bacterium]|nr:TonB-dependent receptor [Cyclobacteriaceae bacterium HetDA_MAG_MS6]
EDNTFRNEARNYVGRFNYQIPLKVGESTGYFKTGAKYRNIRNTRTRDSQVFTYDRTRQRDFPTPQEQIYATLVDDFEDNRFMVGEARFGRGLNENKVRDFTAESLALGVWNPEGDQTSISELSHFYIADEQVYAGYGMGKLNIGKLMILAGARYERTTIDYDAWQLEINGEDLDDSTRVSVDRAFDFLLPNVHFKLSPDRSTNFRAAATFSYGRPNFIDLSPVVTIRETDGEIRKGNIDLVPSRAFNLDLMYERFLPDVGIISVGLFSKHIQNFVATRTVRIDSSNYQNFIDFNPFANRPQYTLIQKENGDQGVVFGVELNLQTQLTFLSPFLRNFGIYANYTFADSEAFVNEFDPSSGTETTRRVDLPDQARHFGNFALTFDKGGFSGRVSVNYIGKVIIGYNGENSEFHDNSDQFRAGRYQLDISANYKLNKRFSVFTEFLNVTNQPIIEYQETRDYPIRVEYFGWWNRFGLSYRI